MNDHDKPCESDYWDELERRRGVAVGKTERLEQMAQGIDQLILAKHKTERTNERLRRGLESIRAEATRLLTEEAE